MGRIKIKKTAPGFTLTDHGGRSLTLSEFRGMSAETTYGSITEDFGLPDQWNWSEPGRVYLPEEELKEILDGVRATGSR